MHFAVIATLVLAAVIVLLGLVAMIRPEVFSRLAKYFVNQWGIWVAAGIRLFAAVVLWYVAPVSRSPGTFKVLAGIALIAALAVLIAGHERIKVLVDWSISRPPWVLRLFAAFPMALGGFLLWALLM